MTMPVIPIAMFGVSLSDFLMPMDFKTLSFSVFGSSSSGTNMVTSSPVAVEPQCIHLVCDGTFSYNAKC